MTKQNDLSAKEAAEYLNVHPKTLYRWRLTGIGPPYRQIIGRIVYSKKSVDDWLVKLEIRAQNR